MRLWRVGATMDPPRGGFRWGSDEQTYTVVDPRRSRRLTREPCSCAFIVDKKAFVVPTGLDLCGQINRPDAPESDLTPRLHEIGRIFILDVLSLVPRSRDLLRSGLDETSLLQPAPAHALLDAITHCGSRPRGWRDAPPLLSVVQFNPLEARFAAVDAHLQERVPALVPGRAARLLVPRVHLGTHSPRRGRLPG